MTTIGTIKVAWQEDGSAIALARVCADDATGAWTTVPGEGNFVKQADLSTITCKVFDRSDTVTPDTPIATPSVTLAAILDAPVTDQHIWDIDSYSYNFKYKLPGTCFPIGGHRYRVEFYFTATGGSTWVLAYEGMADQVVGS